MDQADMTPAQRLESRFCVFQAPWWGIRAMAKVLHRYYHHHGLMTVKGIVSRYAPAHENDTSNYSRVVAAALKVTPEKHLNWDWQNLTTMMRTMIKMENGVQPYSWEIEAGIVMAGIRPAIEFTNSGDQNSLGIRYT